MKRLISLFFIAVASIIVGGARPSLASETPPYVVILLIDGARSDVVHELAAQGKLPNIQKLFIDGGLDVVHGTTVFPTTSTNAYQSFMTGLFPGHAGIPYLARYSRTEKESIEYLSLKGLKIMNADLLNWYQLNDPKTPYTTTQGSLFDHLSSLGTASIYATFNRDATLQTPKLPLRAAWNTFVLHDHEMLDTLAYTRLKRLYEGPIDKIPHLSFIALLSIDILAHQEGAHAPRLLNHFTTIDRMIGDFWALLEKQGLANNTYLVIVGDHGNHDISERSYLRERLIKEGVAIRSRHMRPPYELAINARGVSCAIIAVAGQTGWKSYPTLEDLRRVPTRKGKEIDLIEYLRHQPETDLLLVRNNNHHVRIFNQDSEAEITRVWSSGKYWYSYRTLNGSDPLRYTEDPKLKSLIANNTPLTAAQWLPLTAQKEYGDAIVQIGQIFTDGRVGDMIIVPKPNWVFRHEKASTHGSLSQEDMHIPIMMHGPTLAPQKIAYGRSVDVMPTILSWYGKTTPHRDGQNLLAPDTPPSKSEMDLAQLEVRLLNGATTVSRNGLSSSQLAQEEQRRQERVEKLATLTERCTQRRPKPEDRLTRADRRKKIRVSTCEVVDLAAKTAYEDLQRLQGIRKPQVTHATHNPL
jgi:predicted AlkP superfamily pyrophosphatase or phosphodiesterase